MFEEVLNKPLLRAIVGIVAGVPLTLLAFFIGAHGLILGYAGITEGKILLLTSGVLTVTGLAGIGGAWARLLISSENMTKTTRQVVRFLLWCGVFSGLGLAIWSVLIEDISIVSLLLVIPALAGLVFISATPKAL